MAREADTGGGSTKKKVPWYKKIGNGIKKIVTGGDKSSSSNKSKSSSSDKDKSSSGGKNGPAKIPEKTPPKPIEVKTPDGGTEVTPTFTDTQAANYPNRDVGLNGTVPFEVVEDPTPVTDPEAERRLAALKSKDPVPTTPTEEHFSQPVTPRDDTPEPEVNDRSIPQGTGSGGMTSEGAAGNTPDRVLDPEVADDYTPPPETPTKTSSGGGIAGAPSLYSSSSGGNFWSQGMPTVEATADKDPKKKGKGRRRKALRLGAKSLAIPTVGSGGGGKSVGS